MRLRLSVLASLAAALAALVVPSTGSAAPHHNRGLTINVTANPILAGEAVEIYGRLTPAAAGQTIVLYHHLAGSGQGYTRVQSITTDANGFYSFPRADGVVMTNRSWFAREAGAPGVHSRTIYERVSALVSIAASQTQQDTSHPIVFNGHVTPDHAFQRVLLQEANGSSDDWRTLKAGRLDGGSNYAIAYRWRISGEHEVRVLFPGDRRNIEGASDSVTITIQQTQVPGFTINTSAPIVDYQQQAVTISGTATSAPTKSVTLYAHVPGQSGFVPIANTTTGTDGSYSFPGQMPSENTLYQVRTTFAPHRHSAVLFEGVRDVLQMQSSASQTEVGQKVMFTGTVLPDKAGHFIYLQRLGADGDWHVVEVRFVSPGSTYQFGWRFGDTGTYQFRARITSDGKTIGSASAPVTVTVTPAPTASLPPAT